MLSLTSKVTSALTVSLLSFSAFSATSNSENALSGSGELGFSDSTGNTVNTSLYGALKLNYTQKNYIIKSAIEANYKSENGTQTEERYIVDIQGNRYYSANKSYYSFVGAKFEKNQFADIELDSTFSLGLGKNLYKTEATLLTGEIGLGYQNTDYVTQGVESKSQGVGLAKLDLTHKINAQVLFTQNLAISAGEEQTKIESNTGFKVKVAEKMNLKASYKIRHNDKPAAGTEKTDTQTMLTLIYDF
ncbi:DUF481 domain-containing protein [Thiomicrorhabdus lithotrophica]|uniref:DUF481 domain-containing protein n=1 Tax=Thiomicrorhabdus lithotrophica TaxID=2949997 RepID=A0ABY8C6F6_9GAMM|nr:DUF481 domain-containing protein [Thiomicrorhabdus lithotrophica]WEJ61555.1 DUF481 domain-containing protein [Thiomicrorhabdus lithotrophica]